MAARLTRRTPATSGGWQATARPDGMPTSRGRSTAHTSRGPVHLPIPERVVDLGTEVPATAWATSVPPWCAGRKAEGTGTVRHTLLGLGQLAMFGRDLLARPGPGLPVEPSGKGERIPFHRGGEDHKALHGAVAGKRARQAGSSPGTTSPSVPT
ncbi:hypothetical protein GCM10023084_24580 [Streptomyces lacrimifluminis]|uniref:Uncharacterized protein n=1 Tax=Streptomyces lacrimifluminis TaxID=1500077 RepID=A0A917NNS0_9ACTN|nr:hypothetical protein [Streptomyces lacrimifluminis]GGJ14661.1 hypothetical protein GCM10012282_08670 [Streptomyces lacrimifluminis]